MSEHYCSHCGRAVELPSNARPGRTETCAGCSADLHCCLNCVHYDPSSYNECREPQAERVVDKQKSNYCDYFRFSLAKPENLSRSENLKKLDDVFK